MNLLDPSASIVSSPFRRFRSVSAVPLAAVVLALVLLNAACSPTRPGGPTLALATLTSASSPTSGSASPTAASTPALGTPTGTISAASATALALTPTANDQTPANTATTPTVLGGAGTTTSPSTVATTGTVGPADSVVATATAQAIDTAIAQSVAATVTVEVPALATAAMLDAQQTVVAGATNVATGSAPLASPSVATAGASPTRSAAISCPTPPVRGFGLLFSTNAAVATRIGCSLAPEVGLATSLQTFDGGIMIELAPQVYVLRTQGMTWSSVQAARTSQPLPTASPSPPAGHYAPSGVFGQVWETQSPVRAQLGWATAPEQDFPDGAKEEFAHGQMIWIPTKIIYVLYADNTWQSFPDNFQG